MGRKTIWKLFLILPEKKLARKWSDRDLQVIFQVQALRLSHQFIVWGPMTNKTFLRISLANQKGESLPSKKQDYAILNIGAFGWFNSLCSLVLSSFQVQKSILPNTPDFATSIIIEMVDLGIQCMSSKEKSQIVLLLLLFFVCFRMRLWYWK